MLQVRGATLGAALVLGNDQSAASLMVGAAGTYTPGSLSFASLALYSSGSALVHGAQWMRLESQAAWSHEGTLVVGASAPVASVADLHASLQLLGGATLGPGFGTLDVVVGSAGLGSLSVEHSASLMASTITLGAGAPQARSDRFTVSGGSVQVQDLHIGRVNGARVSLFGYSDAAIGTLVAERVQLGEGGGESELQIGPWGRAQINQLSVATLAGSSGRVEVQAGGQLDIGASLGLGSAGQGSLVSHGRLTAQSVNMGGTSPLADAQFVTTGATQLGRVNMEGHSSWVTHGATYVDGYVTVAQYGGRDVLLQVASSGELHVAQNLWAGDYHVSGAQPIDQRLVVDAGARLVVDGAITLYATAQLSGGGTVVTPNLWVYDGTVAPGSSPGHLTIDGDMSFVGGQLVIELGGLAPGTGHDVLEVLGSLTISQWGRGTTLVLQAVDGFVPQPGQGFDFLRAAHIEGSFAGLVDQTGLDLTLDDLQLHDGHFGINLAAAVPEPPAALLMLLGVLALGQRLRRVAR